MMIRMPRGDHRLIRFKVLDPDQTTTDIDFNEVYFTVKETTRKHQFCFQKRLSTGGIVKLDLGDYQVEVEPADTNNMIYGNYKFDIQFDFISPADEQLKETFVGDFVITDEVTFAENE